MANKTKVLIATGLIAVGGYVGADLAYDSKVPTDTKLEAVKGLIQEVKEVDDLRCDRFGQNCVNSGKVKKYYYVGEKMSDKTSLELTGKANYEKVSEDYGYVVYKKGDEKVVRLFNGKDRIKDSSGIFYEYNHATTTLKQYQKSTEESLISRIFGRNAIAQSTFYPDPSETNGEDLATGRVGVNETFADIRAGTGNECVDAVDISAFGSPKAAGKYDRLYRSTMCFKTGDVLDSGDSVTAGTLSLYGAWKADQFNITGMNITGATPSDPTNLGCGDYASTTVGYTAFSSAKTISAWSTAGYNDYTLNASGIAHIDPADTFTCFSFLLQNDIDNSGFTATGDGSDGGAQAYNSEYTGTARDPKLVITYTEGGGEAPVEIQRESEWFY